MSQVSIQEALEWRYAVKRFDPTKKISACDWKTLTESLKLSPSSFGLQPWRFIIVDSKEMREKLKGPSTYNVSQVMDSSHYVVLTYKEKMDPEFINQYIERIAEVRDVPLESLEGFRKSMTDALVTGPRSQTIEAWAQRQTFIAMGFLMETAALLKVDSCPIEGIDAEGYDEVLGLKGTGWKTLACVALGYRHPEDKYQHNKKVRFSDDVLFRYVK